MAINRNRNRTETELFGEIKSRSELVPDTNKKMPPFKKKYFLVIGFIKSIATYLYFLTHKVGKKKIFEILVWNRDKKYFGSILVKNSFLYSTYKPKFRYE